MREPFFNSPARTAKLVIEAAHWKGTPWRANSAAKQYGVSCHNLPRSIFIACGAWPPSFLKVEGNPSQATAQNLMEPFLDGRPELVRLKEGELLHAGDLIGLWLAVDHNGKRVRTRHTNHLGIVLDCHWFVHVLAHKTTDFDLHNVSPWIERIVAAWRPVYEQRPNQQQT